MVEVRSAFYKTETIRLHYYEVENDLQPLVMIHAQGVDGLNFKNTFKKLSEKFHIFSVDCYGHGESLHDAEKYNIKDISEAIIEFIEKVVKDKVFLLGHSSGGLIAAYIAAKSEWCRYLILEDPPFFSCQGERRKHSFNFVDLSTVCHQFLNQQEENDFILYYFSNQYAWNFFPENSRDKVRKKMVSLAAKYRKKHPQKKLKVPFWPKSALSGFEGMNQYDPHFGEAFYTDSFNDDIMHEDFLREIQCETSFLKAETNVNEDGLLMAALDEEDLKHVCELIPDCHVKRFECGHGIHIEKEKEFMDYILTLT